LQEKDRQKKDNIPTIDINKVIKEKNPKLYKIIPSFFIKWIKKIIHQDILNTVIINNYNNTPEGFAKYSLDYFGIKRVVKGVENLPKENKRMVFVANHPLGGLDGMAFVEVVTNIYGEVRFPVNDLLLNVPALKEVFIPINKHGKQSRESIIAIEEAFKSDKPILYFPAGLCSRKENNQIIDLDWKKSFLTQAIKYKRDVVPVFIKGRNSNFFYNLANIRKFLGFKFNAEMLFLVDEMVKQNKKELIITFGKPIPWTTFNKNKNIKDWVDFVRNKTYELEE
jgi:putative hemolysin